MASGKSAAVLYGALLAACFGFAIMWAGECSGTKLKLGSRGACVQVVQGAVGTNADGIFGKLTKQAVMRFQENRGLAVDGIVGPRTWEAIYGEGNTEQGSGGSVSGNGCGCGYDYATKNSGGETPGAQRLKQYLLQNFNGRSGGIYNYRKVRNGKNLSLHAEGRAVDFFPNTKAEGDRVFAHLRSIACSVGIQEIIWYRQYWNANGGLVPYTGSPPHTDHLHIGLNRCGAQNFGA